jgi:outer membrane lipoprotein-sorting protein
MRIALRIPKALCVPALALCLSLPAAAQEIVSAEKYFAALSASYGAVKDYEAALTVTQGKSVSRGKISYKTPMYLRIDFDDPKGQVISFDGEMFTVFVPQYEVVLQQKYRRKGAGAVAAMASSQGLTLLQRSYNVAFMSSPGPVALDEDSREQVVKLKLTARGITGYRQLVISVSKDSLVRRIEGVQTNGEKITLDFTGIRTNQGLPDSRFQYDPPAYANVIPDFLFDSEE